LLLEQHVTLLWLTAGLFHQMVSDALPALCSVQQIVAGGEALSLSHVKQVLAHLPQGGRLVNGYGPTENTTFTCCYSLWHPEQLGASVPIGYPIANTYVYVLDQRLEPVPIGVPGELYIGGAGLARGYLHQPALTAERFIPDPWTQEPGARLYQTGDRVRWRSDGSLEFPGRLDQQVKLRGYRIEPGEIEVVLEQHPAVQQCVVQFDHSQQTPHLSSLVAYVVADEQALSNQLSEGSLQQEHVDHWLQLYEETYQKQRMLDDANLDLVGWNSSYTREPIPPEQMLEQIEQTCQRIQALSPRRIVEIGCGTGLLLLRL